MGASGLWGFGSVEFMGCGFWVSEIGSRSSGVGLGGLDLQMRVRTRGLHFGKFGIDWGSGFRNLGLRVPGFGFG